MISLAFRALHNTTRLVVVLLLLLTAITAGCNGGCSTGVDDTLTKLAAFQRLHTSTATSPVPPSHVYCGNINKNMRGPGNCAGIGTGANGQIPAFERTEVRGWIVGGLDWPEQDEVR